MHFIVDDCIGLQAENRTPNAKVAGWTPARATRLNNESPSLREVRAY